MTWNRAGIDPATVGGLRSDVLELTRDNDKLRFDLGLTQLGFDDGQFDTYVDNSKIDTVSGASTTFGAGDTGRISIAKAIDEASTQTDGSLLQYAIDSVKDVESTALTFTGNDATNSVTESYSRLTNGDSFNYSIDASKDVDTDVTLIGGEPIGDSEWSSSVGIAANSVVVDEENDRVFVTTSDGEIVAFDETDGSELWRKPSPAGDGFDRGLAVNPNNEQVYAGQVDIDSNAEQLVAFDATNGNFLWSNTTTSYSSVYGIDIDFTNNVVYATFGDSGYTKGYNESDGSEQNSIYNDNDDWPTDVKIDDDTTTAYLSVENNNDIISHDYNANSVNWRFSKHTDSVENLAWDENNDIIYSAGHDGVRALDIASKDNGDSDSTAQLWEYTDSSNSYYTVVYDDNLGYVFAGNSNGEIVVIDASDGSEISVFSNFSNYIYNIYASESEGMIYIPEENGTIKKYKTNFNGSGSPSVTIDGNTISTSDLTGGESYTETINQSPGSYTANVSVNGGVDVDISYTEITETIDPSITITAPSGTQTIDYTGTLADGQTVDLSADIDESLIADDPMVVFDETVSDGGTRSYDVDATVDTSVLEVTGKDAVSTQNNSYDALENGDSISFDVDGTTDTELNVEFVPLGEGGGGSNRSSFTGIDSGDVRGVAVDESSGRAFFGGGSNIVYAIDNDQESLWTFDYGSTIEAVTYDSGVDEVYVTGRGSDVVAIDASDGTELWQASNPDGNNYFSITVNPAAGSNGIVYAGESNGSNGHQIIGIEQRGTNAGNVLFQNAVSSSSGTIRGLDSDDSGSLIFAASTNGYIYGLNASDVSINWEYSGSSDMYDVAYHSVKDTVYSINRGTDEVKELDGSSGNENWTYTTNLSFPNGIDVSEKFNVAVAAAQSSEAIDIDTQSQLWTNNSGNNNAVSINDEQASAYITEDSGVSIVNLVNAPDDPSVTIDGTTVSYSGVLNSGTYTETLSDIAPSSYSGNVTLSDGWLRINLDWVETTETIDPSVTLDSPDGTQTISYTGTIADGVTEDLSSQIDNSQIGGGTVNVSATISDSVTSPTGQAIIDHRINESALVDTTRNIDVDVAVSEAFSGPTGEVDLELLASPNSGSVTHQTKDLGFVPVEVTLNDDVVGDDSAVSYTIEDGNGNTVSIPRSDVDTIVDCSNFTSSTITVTANISDLQTDLLEWGAYFQ